MNVSKIKLRPILLAGLLLLLVPLLVSGETLRGEAQSKPWSGYWWPLQQGELVRGYQGHPSPIEKYDLYTKGYYPATATYAAQNQWYDPDVPYWYGFCNGWANAAIMEPIKIVPSVVNGIYLAVGDKKGLLAAYHSKDLTLSENCRSSPAPFHRYLLQYLGEQGQAVAANLDNSGEFWSYPIYKYEMTIAQGASYDQVHCTITYADDQGLSPDFEGTKIVEKSYEYRLNKDAAGNYISGNSSASGEWTGASLIDHPVLVWVPIGLRPDKNFIDYDEIRSMALSVDDELEGEDLVPGHHILLINADDKDFFELRPKIGEHIFLQVAFDRQSPFTEGAHMILRRNGVIVSDMALNFSRQLLEIDSETGSDYYQLSFIPDNDNSQAVVVQLYADFNTANEFWSYGFPSSKYWTGFASLAGSENRMYAEVVGEQGLPVNSGKKSDSLAAGQRCLGLFGTAAVADYFTVDNQPQAVKLSTISPAVSLVFSGNDQCLWGTSQCLTGGAARRLVIPWLRNGFNSAERGDLFLHNLSLSGIDLTIHYHSEDGKYNAEREMSLPAKMIRSFGGLVDYPGGVSLDGWALIESDKDGLDGAILRTKGSIVKDQLSFLVPGKEKLIPHLAVGGGWDTTVCLYNPDSRDIRVNLIFNHAQTEPKIYTISIPAYAQTVLQLDGAMWAIDNNKINGGWLKVESDHEFAGFFSYNFADSAASIALMESPENEVRWLPHVVCDENWWTGVAFVNFTEKIKTISLVALADNGRELERKEIEIGARGKEVRLADRYFTASIRDELVAIRLENGTGVAALGIFGRLNGGSQITGFNW